MRTMHCTDKNEDIYIKMMTIGQKTQTKKIKRCKKRHQKTTTH